MNRLGFKSNIFLAPMAGITDKPMRRLVSSFGPGTVVSEMVAVNAVQRRNSKSYRIADVRDEPYPVVVQLVGGEASLFADVVKLIEELGAFSVDQYGLPGEKNCQQSFRFGTDAGYERRRRNHQNRCRFNPADDQCQIPQRLGSPTC